MDQQQNWSTEMYKGMEVHVTPLEKSDRKGFWDYTVRVVEPGVDASASSELVAQSGDQDDYSTSEKALAAGFERGYAMVDALDV